MPSIRNPVVLPEERPFKPLIYHKLAPLINTKVPARRNRSGPLRAAIVPMGGRKLPGMIAQ
jgi:hypothetical protein